MKKINVAILGFGTVGSGVYKILTDNKLHILGRTGLDLNVTKIFNRSLKKGLPEELYVNDFNMILQDDEIDVVVEVLGGIEAATEYMLQAMNRKKSVVSANKAAIAANLKELTETALNNNVNFLYEASVAGGIPILTSIRENLLGNQFRRVMGILNGTTNYILTKMNEENMSYDDALKMAQQLGFAEADPTADVEGIDVANKLSILIYELFGEIVKPENIEREGISNVSKEDLKRAESHDSVLKLIGEGSLKNGELIYSVGLREIPKSSPLAKVSGELNGVILEGDMVGEVFLTGKGAGSLPTGSAVVGDIILCGKNI